jgi:CPA1 family monovalent cation:H+ antiporter
LFVLIGLELMLIPFHWNYLILSLFALLLTLGVRYIALSVPSVLLNFRKDFEPNTLKIMTWGGLRGGISIALALSIPASPEKELIVAITYGVVLMSLLIQGLTLEKYVIRLGREA